MLAFSIVAVILATAKLQGLSRGASWAAYIPSGIAFAIGFLNPPSFSIARLVGGFIEWKYRQYLKKTHSTDTKDIRVIIIASGFVLGEGVASIVGLLLKIFGMGVASCWGCGSGICSACPRA